MRESSGGLRNVRAIGFFVEERGCVTVSMNLIDTDATPIYRAFELVRLEASRHGLRVLEEGPLRKDELGPRDVLSEQAQSETEPAEPS